MRILYIHQYFTTPEKGGAVRSYWISQAMQKAGHEVVVISGADTHAGYEEHNGVEVHYLKVAYNQSMSARKRIGAFRQFQKKALRLALGLGDFDLVYATSTPLTIGQIARRYKAKTKTPYFFEVRDLWPKIPIEMGIVKSALLKRFLNRLEKKIYNNAVQIIALSPDMSAHIKTVSPATQLTLVPNMCDISKVEQSAPGSHPKISYVGSMGRANDPEFFVAFSYVLHDIIPEAKIHVMMQGSEALKVEANSASNVIFHPFGGRKKAQQLISDCDANLVTYADYPTLATGSPNKFFDGLAQGKPTLYNFGGWIDELIGEKGGIRLDREDLKSSVRLLKESFQDERWKAMSDFASELRHDFDKDVLCGKIVELLQ